MNFKESKFNRNNDLEEVFNQRYKANYGNNELVQEKKKDFNFKMFGIRDKGDVKREMREANSDNGRVNNLNQKMNAMNNINRFNKRDFR